MKIYTESTTARIKRKHQKSKKGKLTFHFCTHIKTYEGQPKYQKIELKPEALRGIKAFQNISYNKDFDTHLCYVHLDKHSGAIILAIDYEIVNRDLYRYLAWYHRWKFYLLGYR